MSWDDSGFVVSVGLSDWDKLNKTPFEGQKNDLLQVQG